jgi:hypothetical protein
MSILNTVTTHIEYSAEGVIKIGNSMMNAINSLAAAGRVSFTADDIAHVINNNVKAERNKVTVAQVERAVKTELKHNERGEIRKGFKRIAALGSGFYQYGK